MRKQLFIGVMALGLSPLALASGAYAPPAPAAPAFTPGVVVGLQLGYGLTWYSHLKNTFATSVSNDDAFAGRVYVGYDFHPNFAVEFGYTSWFSKPKANLVAPLPTVKASDYPWALDLVGKIKAHVVDQFGLYAKAGVDYINSELKGGGFKVGGDEFNVVYGVGAFYDFTPNISADLSWTRYTANGDLKANTAGTKLDYIPGMDLYALGVSYKFDIS